MGNFDWIDDFISFKAGRPSPDPEPVPGNKKKRKKGEKEGEAVTAVTIIPAKGKASTLPEEDDFDDPSIQELAHMVNGLDISWLEGDEGIATKKWSAAARKAALAARRAKSRAKGGLGGAASGAGAAKIVPQAMKPAVVRRMDKLNRSDPKAYNKAIKQHARATGVDTSRAHAQVAAHQLDETIAGRRRSPSSAPKGLEASPHAAAQRAGQRRAGSASGASGPQKADVRPTDAGTTRSPKGSPAGRSTVVGYGERSPGGRVGDGSSPSMLVGKRGTGGATQRKRDAAAAASKVDSGGGFHGPGPQKPAQSTTGRPMNPAATARALGVSSSRLRELERSGYLIKGPNGYDPQSVDHVKAALARGELKRSKG